MNRKKNVVPSDFLMKKTNLGPRNSLKDQELFNTVEDIKSMRISINFIKSRFKGRFSRRASFGDDVLNFTQQTKTRKVETKIVTLTRRK